MNDWDPTSSAAQRNPLVVADDMRGRCPVAHSRQLGWSVFRHADVMRVLHDPELFSSRVSAHHAVPNGMDPPEHTAYRRALEPAFSAARMTAFEPVCRRLAAEVVEGWTAGAASDFVAAVARLFATRVQCAFLNWPEEVHTRLLKWTSRSQAATAAGDRQAQEDLAEAFRRLGALVLAPRATEVARRSVRGPSKGPLRWPDGAHGQDAG